MASASVTVPVPVWVRTWSPRPWSDPDSAGRRQKRSGPVIDQWPACSPRSRAEDRLGCRSEGSTTIRSTRPGSPGLRCAGPKVGHGRRLESCSRALLRSSTRGLVPGRSGSNVLSRRARTAMPSCPRHSGYRVATDEDPPSSCPSRRSRPKAPGPRGSSPTPILGRAATTTTGSGPGSGVQMGGPSEITGTGGEGGRRRWWR